eukprot:CAMPEP_0183305878 /NCGR_PEP_ID=MMETSP0160_2-20130417/10480_1 /TAXON_ID=2839 ORGANISM="Odontella Sinensis, Strain Grunow 1884" /NCGR_SAMPLE_ID=MMETSP0160_2 /ASSEMBLY_ACC=CAM_ASM_000250 /LENGTH=76 /DNA_ID=CAMNT_0025469155 /DNA_START=145 /DNA_END=375 /DNA_ORIENTATION=-
MKGKSPSIIHPTITHIPQPKHHTPKHEHRVLDVAGVVRHRDALDVQLPAPRFATSVTGQISLVRGGGPPFQPVPLP